ncbi:MAG: hypothetical protein ACLSVD_11045 [Eggerthellaceae bacterium]
MHSEMAATAPSPATLHRLVARHYPRDAFKTWECHGARPVENRDRRVPRCGEAARGSAWCIVSIVTSWARPSWTRCPSTTPWSSTVG